MKTFEVRGDDLVETDTPAVVLSRQRDRMCVELVVNQVGPSVIITKENPKGGFVWQHAMTIDEANAMYRALGVTLSQVAS